MPVATGPIRSAHGFSTTPCASSSKRYTDKALDYGYFSQDLLPAYQRQHGKLTGLYYDPRGVLYEPHTRQSHSPGHARSRSLSPSPPGSMTKSSTWRRRVSGRSSRPPSWRSAMIWRLWRQRAMPRKPSGPCLSMRISDRQYQLFVLHDADPDGYNIARTLREATERMPDYPVRSSI